VAEVQKVEWFVEGPQERGVDHYNRAHGLGQDNIPIRLCPRPVYTRGKYKSK